jgi:hypothetical protein
MVPVMKGLKALYMIIDELWRFSEMTDIVSKPLVVYRGDDRIVVGHAEIGEDGSIKAVFDISKRKMISGQLFPENMPLVISSATAEIPVIHKESEVEVMLTQDDD